MMQSLVPQTVPPALLPETVLKNLQQNQGYNCYNTKRGTYGVLSFEKEDLLQ